MNSSGWVMLTHRGVKDDLRYFDTKKEAVAEGKKKRAQGYNLVDVVPVKQLCADPDPYCTDAGEAEMEALSSR